MKVCSIFFLIVTIVSLPTSNGQCTLCADGSTPPNGGAILPVPGLDSANCSVVAQLIGTSNPAQCTQAQAAGYLICGCPTVPGPNLDLPCAFCADGTVPTNLDVVVTLPDSSSASCQDLMARASLLADSSTDTERCADIVEAASSACGCPAAAVGSETTIPESAMPSAELESFESAMPSSADSTTESETPGSATPGSEPPSSPSLEPTAELAMSNARCIFGARVVVGSTLIGMVAALA